MIDENLIFNADGSVQQPDIRSKRVSILRGFKQKCPACGEGRMFGKYLKVHDKCPSCGEELHHQRADDAPPYFTILIVAHIVGAGILWTEQTYAPPTWVHWIIWLPLLLVLSLWLLPRVKGALIGLQWALRMHGFGGPDSDFTDPSVAVPLAAADRI
jgi:uncharacterized protein (DUF983 family)